MQSLKKIHAWAQMKVPLLKKISRRQKKYEKLPSLLRVESLCIRDNMDLHTCSYTKTCMMLDFTQLKISQIFTEFVK